MDLIKQNVNMKFHERMLGLVLNVYIVADLVFLCKFSDIKT